METNNTTKGNSMSVEIKLTFAVATSGDLASWADGYHSASIGPLNDEQIDFMEQMISADTELDQLFQDEYTPEMYKDVSYHRYDLLEKGRELGLVKSKFFGRSRWTLITLDAGNGFANVDYPYANLGQEVQS